MPTGDLDTARDVVGQFTRATDRFVAVSDRLANTLQGHSGGGSSHVSVSLGGGSMVLVVCLVCAIVSVASTFVSGIWLLKQHQEITEMRADLRGQRAWVQRLIEERQNER